MIKDLSKCRLYGILDLSYADKSRVREIAQRMIDGGVDVIQLRGKQQSIDELADLAAQLHEVTASANVPLVVNDHPQIARQTAVEGLHLGQDDETIGAAREKIGRSIIIGKSTHSFEQAIGAVNEGADYIGFGPVFATPTKPDYRPIGLNDIKRVLKQVSVPVFCIGGIKLTNLEQVIAAGANRVVIVSGLLQAANIMEYARAAKQLLLASRVAAPVSPSSPL